MRPVLVATIPNSGTRFFAELVGHHLGRKCFLMRGRDKPYPSTAHQLARCHIEPDNMALLQNYICRFRPIIINTERDKKSICKSLLSRGKDIRMLPEMFALEEVFREQYQPLIMSVDSADRDDRLLKLGEAFNTTFTTRWQKVGSIKTGE